MLSCLFYERKLLLQDTFGFKPHLHHLLVDLVGDGLLENIYLNFHELELFENVKSVLVCFLNHFMNFLLHVLKANQVSIFLTNGVHVMMVVVMMPMVMAMPMRSMPVGMAMVSMV